jgi:hypothetical protein
MAGEHRFINDLVQDVMADEDELQKVAVKQENCDPLP